MNQTNIVDMTADTSRRIWKSMSNWRLYSFNQNELNRRVQEPGQKCASISLGITGFIVELLEEVLHPPAR